MEGTQSIHNTTPRIEDKLKLMGYKDEIIRKACTLSPNKGIEGVVQYISENYQMLESGNTGVTGISQGQQLYQHRESISGYVNPTFRDQLISFGYRLPVAEKALFLTDSASTKLAMEWLIANADLKDLNEPLYLPKRGQNPSQKLTPNEVKNIAYQLKREYALKRKFQDETKNALKISSNNINNSRTEFEKKQIQQHIDSVKREKIETDLAKSKILQDIENDFYEKTGIKKDLKKVPEDIYKILFRNFLKVYPIGSMSESVLKKCLKTVLIYIGKSNNSKI